jgi:hypothetical protein
VSTALATQSHSAEVELFDLMQRKARLFASSPLVPEHIRKNGTAEGLANCYIALVLAQEMGENPLVVMQNIYIVKGKAGWSASYMIAKANASGVFKGVIRWRYENEGTDKLKCTAYATLAETGETVDASVDWPMAVAEGWTSNSKYKSMPKQMFAYRSATLLVRLYCPQVMLGYHTAEENETLPPDIAPQRITMSEVIEAADGVVVDGVPGDAPAEKPAEPKKAEEPTDDTLHDLCKQLAAKHDVEIRDAIAVVFQGAKLDAASLEDLSTDQLAKGIEFARARLAEPKPKGKPGKATPGKLVGEPDEGRPAH